MTCITLKRIEFQTNEVENLIGAQYTCIAKYHHIWKFDSKFSYLLQFTINLIGSHALCGTFYHFSVTCFKPGEENESIMNCYVMSHFAQQADLVQSTGNCCLQILLYYMFIQCSYIFAFVKYWTIWWVANQLSFLLLILVQYINNTKLAS